MRNKAAAKGFLTPFLRPKFLAAAAAVVFVACVLGMPRGAAQGTASQSAAATAVPTPRVLMLLAHPDDEAVAMGTLAELAKRNVAVKVVFTTSGDAGRDVRGILHDPREVAAQREKESTAALKVLGVDTPPVFLRAPDGRTMEAEHSARLLDQFRALHQAWRAPILISFGPDGVTGHPDHVVLALLAQRLADESPDVQVLLNMAYSRKKVAAMQKLVDKYHPGAAMPFQWVDDNAVSMRVDVSEHRQRIRAAMDVHKTKFPTPLVDLFDRLLKEFPHEEFILARDRTRRAPSDISSLLKAVQTR